MDRDHPRPLAFLVVTGLPSRRIVCLDDVDVTADENRDAKFRHEPESGWSACSRYDDAGRSEQRPHGVPIPRTRDYRLFRLEQ